MAEPTNKTYKVKEYNKIGEYKDLEIKIEKIWHLKTTTVPVIIGTLSMDKKGRDKHIKKISVSSSLYEIQKKKLHIVELLISLREYYQWDKKYHSLGSKQKINK